VKDKAPYDSRPSCTLSVRSPMSNQVITIPRPPLSLSPLSLSLSLSRALSLFRSSSLSLTHTLHTRAAHVCIYKYICHTQKHTYMSYTHTHICIHSMEYIHRHQTSTFSDLATTTNTELMVLALRSPRFAPSKTPPLPYLIFTTQTSSLVREFLQMQRFGNTWL